MSLIVSKTKEQIKEIIKNAALSAISKGELCEAEISDFTIEAPANREHGDYAVNAAMAWARVFKKAPRQIAEVLLANANFEGSYISKTEIAGPGFINFFLSDKYYADILEKPYKERLRECLFNPLCPLLYLSQLIAHGQSL